MAVVHGAWCMVHGAWLWCMAVVHGCGTFWLAAWPACKLLHMPSIVPCEVRFTANVDKGRTWPDALGEHASYQALLRPLHALLRLVHAWPSGQSRLVPGPGSVNQS